MVLYRDFRVGDLYKNIKRGKRIVKKDRIKGDTPLVTAGEENYGISEYIKEHSTHGDSNSITIDMFGNVFYREKGFYMDDNIINLYNPEYNRYRNIYIVSSLKYLTEIYSYSKQFRMKSLEETFVELPVKTLEDTEPDWEYIEYYIKQKELDYINKLDEEFKTKINYLEGLIREESEYINIEELPTAKFKVGDLFEVGRGNVGNQRNLKEDNGGINFIAQNDSNNGYVMKVKEEEYKVFKGNNIVVGRQTGAIYYQKEEFVTTDGVLVMENDDVIRSEEVGLYITSLLEKQMGMFGYTNTVSAKKLNELEIELPINPEVSELVPDWETMEDYVNGIKHLYKHKEESKHKEKLELLYELTGWTAEDLNSIGFVGGGNN